MIPQLFAYAVIFPIIKFLQAQQKAMTMAVTAGAALVFHAFFSWLFMLKLGWGLAGGALVLNASWWFIVVAKLIYIFVENVERLGRVFLGKLFKICGGLSGCLLLPLSCYDGYDTPLDAGYLKNAEVSVDALSVCTNILGWTGMVVLGFNAAVSVRVSNELGAGHPRTAEFPVVVSIITSFIIGLIMSSLLIIWRKEFPALFSKSEDVQQLVKKLTPILAVSITVNNFQPVLSGVAIGAGWQALVAYVNVGCYYILGIPLGLILGYVLNLGVKSGTCMQTIILFLIVYRTNWNKEASIADERTRKWGGVRDSDIKADSVR